MAPPNRVSSRHNDDYTVCINLQRQTVSVCMILGTLCGPSITTLAASTFWVVSPFFCNPVYPVCISRRRSPSTGRRCSLPGKPAVRPEDALISTTHKADCRAGRTGRQAPAEEVAEIPERCGRSLAPRSMGRRRDFFVWLGYDEVALDRGCGSRLIVQRSRPMRPQIRILFCAIVAALPYRKTISCNPR